jgi:hypothetical protein
LTGGQETSTSLIHLVNLAAGLIEEETAVLFEEDPFRGEEIY